MSDEQMKFESFGDAVAQLYKGKKVQIYLGEGGETTHWADYDIEHKIWIEGEILWASGTVLLVRCEAISNEAKKYTKDILINTFSISCLMEVSTDGVQISNFMKGTTKGKKR